MLEFTFQLTIHLMSRNIEFAPEEFYHLYNRGTEKRNIFVNDSDRDRFVALLVLSNQTSPVRIDNLLQQARQQGQQGRTLLALLEMALEVAKAEPGGTLVDLCAYCLMPNHFHLLVREHSEGGISRFMQKLLTGYTMYFNTRYERTGALFQGTFKAKHAGEDRYLRHLLSYLHINPVKLIEPTWKETGIANRKKAEAYLRQYRYSSFLDYLGEKRAENAIINRDVLPDYFETPGSFKESMRDWLSYTP